MSWLTKRIPTVVGGVLLIGIVVGLLYWTRFSRPVIEEGLVPQQVRITNIQDNKLSVSWTTKAVATGAIEYGVVGEKIEQKAKDDRDVNALGQYLTHHVTVEGLQPNTQYAFRVLSGEKEVRFDNNGSPYTATTGLVIGTTPASKNFYGTVELPSKQSPEGAIVYVALPGAAVASTLVTAAGNYVVTLSTIRSSDLREYAKIDPTATIANVTVTSGKEQSVVSVSLANSAPVPTITLGQNADFLKLAKNAEVAPEIAEVELVPETPTIFNVEPLAGNGETNATESNTITILNPGDEGEVLTTLRPEFRGKGPKGTTLSIAITGQKSVSGNTLVLADGTWSFAPDVDLAEGAQTIKISFISSEGTEEKLTRGFVIQTPSAIDIAFVATPSASKVASATPRSSPLPSQRAAMPATDSGVPVTGVVTNTIMATMAGGLLLTAGLLLLLL